MNNEYESPDVYSADDVDERGAYVPVVAVGYTVALVYFVAVANVGWVVNVGTMPKTAE